MALQKPKIMENQIFTRVPCHISIYGIYLELQSFIEFKFLTNNINL